MGLDGVVMSWTAVIPVKRLDTAKSRLGADDDPRRPELALAFALDVLEACQRTPAIGSIIVVTDDREVIASVTSSAPDVVICPEPDGGGLNGAIGRGAGLATGAVVALAGDLPCLSPHALEHVLELAEAHDRSLLSDTQGSGTAMLLSHDPAALDPRFGPLSRSAHVQGGCIDLGLDADAHARSLLAGARRDVDTPADLWDARRIGVGRHTADVLRRQR
jgi:2-phospho-L-lactate guanylyltransferase